MILLKKRCDQGLPGTHNRPGGPRCLCPWRLRRGAWRLRRGAWRVRRGRRPGLPGDGLGRAGRARHLPRRPCHLGTAAGADQLPGGWAVRRGVSPGPARRRA